MLSIILNTMLYCKNCGSEMIWVGFENGYNIHLCPICDIAKIKLNKGSKSKHLSNLEC